MRLSTQKGYLYLCVCVNELCLDDIKHLPFLCPTSEPMLLSSATRTHKEKRLNHTVNSLHCQMKHRAAS